VTAQGSVSHHRRVYRSVSTGRWAAGTSVAAVGFCVLAVLPGKVHVAGFIGAPLFLLMAWRAWTAGIHVEADGVKIVGFLASRRVRWGDVDHFAVLPLGNYPFVGHVVLRDGRQFGTYGISAAARPKSKAEQFRLQVQGPVDELNEVLGEQRGAGRPAAGGTSVRS